MIYGWTIASHDQAVSHCTTRGNRVNYKELTKVILPRAVREKQETKLYSVNIVERNSTTYKVKIHYIGYDSCEDEWRNEGDIVDLSEAQPSHLLSSNYSLYQELALLIKTSLRSPSRENPEVKICTGFDKLQFDGGIQKLGTLKHEERGDEKYTIGSKFSWTAPGT